MPRPGAPETRGDLAGVSHCAEVVERSVAELGRLDVLVNNVAQQSPVDSPEEVSEQEWLPTFDVNVHSYFRVTKAALPHLREGSSVINTGSVNGIRGNASLLAYSATKGAVPVLTFSLAQSLVERGSGSTASRPARCGRR